MIDPKAVTTYAQYNEDLVLLALFHDVKKGFYIDVGANYPIIDSVTNLFYKRGWNGINIEPIKSLHNQLIKERPNDINLQIGAGESDGQATLREYVKMPGHSTFDASQKKQHSNLEYKEYSVAIRPLKGILAEFAPKHIHFMKIDVEGFEYQVIAGNDWEKYRPEVICVESNHALKNWQSVLTKNDYHLFISDGLNDYYVARESSKRTIDFAERIIELDYRALKQHQSQSWSSDSEELTRLHKVAQAQIDQIHGLEKQAEHLHDLAALSLKQQPWPIRLKRSIYGLTIDWYRARSHATSKDSQ